MEESVQHTISFRIARTANKINHTIATILNDDGIAPEQRILLEILTTCDHANQTTLGAMLNKSATTISRTLNSLERKGFVVKKSIKNDKRVNVIEVTSSGRAILESTKTKVVAFRDEISKKLSTEEKELLFSLLNKLS